MMLAGSITFLPKIHCPVSTTTKLAPTSSVASSILPIEPPLASTLNPSSWHRLDSHVCSRHCRSVPLSTVLMRTSCFGSPHPYPSTATKTHAAGCISVLGKQGGQALNPVARPVDFIGAGLLRLAVRDGSWLG